MECLELLRLEIGGDIVLTALAAVVFARQVNGEPAYGRIEVRLPCVLTTHELAATDFFDEFDDRVLQHILGVLMSSGLVSGEKE